MILQMLTANPDVTSDLTQFSIATSVVCIFITALSGFTIKKMIQLMMSR